MHCHCPWRSGICSAGPLTLQEATLWKVVKKKLQKLSCICWESLHFVHRAVNLLGRVLMKVKERAWKQGLWKCCKIHYCHCAEKDNFPKRNGDIYIIKSLSLSWQLKSMPSLPPMSHCRCACHMGDSRWLLWSTHNYLWIKMHIGVAGHNGLRTQGKMLSAASRSTTWG